VTILTPQRLLRLSIGTREINRTITKRICDLAADVQKQIRFQRFPPDQLFQLQTFRHFHGDECLAFRLTNFINRADAGTIEGRGCWRLPSKSLERPGILREIGWQEFHGNMPAKF
jgi:hypothetical protein